MTYNFIYNDGSIKELAQLRKEGIPLDAVDENGDTLIFSALFSSNYTIVQACVAEGIPLFSHKGNDLIGEICSALNSPDVRIFELVLAEVGNAMVKKAAEANTASIFEFSSLEVIKRIDALCNFYEWSTEEKFSLMFGATLNTSQAYSIIKWLVQEKGADVHYRLDYDGEVTTILHQAAMNYNTSAVRALLECGANPQAKNSSDLSAVDIAEQGSVTFAISVEDFEATKDLFRSFGSANRMNMFH